MGFTTNEGARLYWRADGDPSRPAILLLNAIGTDHAAWDRVMPHLTGRLHVLRMDNRGHGASDAPVGDYTLELLARDASAVLEAAGRPAAIVCGVSLGGMIGLTMARDRPDRVSALVAACTSARMDPATWTARIGAVQSGGTAAIAQAALGRFVTPAFAGRHPEVMGSLRATLLEQDAVGYTGCAAAIRDMDLVAALPGLSLPVLVIGATQDVSTPFPDHGQVIAAQIPEATTAMIQAGHLAHVEAPAEFAAAVLGFAAPSTNAATTEAARTLYLAGLSVRRRVLGDAWVDRSLAGATPFTADYQAMITRIAWQEIWSRPGLDHRTRRLIVLAVTAALARWEEFRLHVHAGLEQGGLSEAELKETLMQLAIYAGVPAANTAFAEAAAILRELRPDG